MIVFSAMNELPEQAPITSRNLISAFSSDAQLSFFSFSSFSLFLTKFFFQSIFQLIIIECACIRCNVVVPNHHALHRADSTPSILTFSSRMPTTIQSKRPILTLPPDIWYPTHTSEKLHLHKVMQTMQGGEALPTPTSPLTMHAQTS